MSNSQVLRGLVVILLLVSWMPVHAGGVEDLQRFLDETQTLRAEFMQTVQSRSGRNPLQSFGRITLQKPGKFHWQIEKPFPQLMVSDGQKIWLYDPDLKQATHRKIDQALGSTPAALLIGGQTWQKYFRLKYLGKSDGLEWAEAIPKNTESGFTHIKLGFSGGELRVLETEDHFGQTTRLDLLRIERNPILPPNLFKFIPPSGIDVLSE